MLQQQDAQYSMTNSWIWQQKKKYNDDVLIKKSAIKTLENPLYTGLFWAWGYFETKRELHYKNANKMKQYKTWCTNACAN